MDVLGGGGGGVVGGGGRLAEFVQQDYEICIVLVLLCGWIQIDR